MMSVAAARSLSVRSGRAVIGSGIDAREAARINAVRVAREMARRRSF